MLTAPWREIGGASGQGDFAEFHKAEVVRKRTRNIKPKQFWAIMLIQQYSLIFGSKTKAQEIAFVLAGVKEVVRQGFYEAELPPVERFCREQGLFLVKSRFKVLLADEEKKNLAAEVYSNKGLRLSEEDSRRGMYFIYISKNEAAALLASYHELVGNHKALGEVLGYPSCCVDFFMQNFTAQNANLMLPSHNLYTNLSKRDKDVVLLSHFPCSESCEKSIALGKRYLEVLENVDKERAAEVKEELG